MLEVGTKVRKKYDTFIGHETEITRRQVIRNTHDGTTEIVYDVGGLNVLGSLTEEGIRRQYWIVDEEATAALNEAASD